MSLRTHLKILKALALGDKEAEAQLVQLYYDTPVEERPKLLDAALKESQKTRQRLKELELRKLEEEEAALAESADAAAETEEELRGEGARGDDPSNGTGGAA